jgi:hypothetical protein
LWTPPVRAALAIAIASRAALAIVAWIALKVFPVSGRYPEKLPDSFFPGQPFLDGWARWDAAHYIAIARFGYGDGNPSPHGGLGFFPVFPLLLRGLVQICGAAETDRNFAIAGLLVANLCFVALIAGFAWLVARRFGDKAAIEASLLLCVMPFSFFFNAVYTESLFALLILLSLAFAGTKRWWLAASFAGIASGTRLVGLALAPALLYGAYRRGAKLPELVGTALLSVSGLLAYFVYCAWKFDNAFAYFDAQAEWGNWDDHVRHYAELFFTHPKQTLTGRPEDLIVLLDLIAGIVFLGFLPRLAKTRWPELFIVSALLIAVQGAFTWLSLGRYVMPALGIYVAMALWLGETRWRLWARDTVVVSSALLLALLTALYATGFWVV